MPSQAGEQQPEQEKNQEQRTATDAGLDVARFPSGPAGAALVAYHLHIVGAEQAEQQPHPAEEQQSETAAAGIVILAHR